MDRVLDGSVLVARCERCNAAVLEEGLCPACLLCEGLAGDVTSGSVSSAAFAQHAPVNGRSSHFKTEDAPFVDGYELLSELGRGGMGVVYLAEQTRPVRRRVALKLIKLGMDTRQVIARFEAERQALALMDHPGVAKVLGAGASDTGRPYFVMELVRGPRITDYCDQYQLSTQERLELFLQVCRAIQHAHQKGIIHRDIKPSNILVTQQDGQATPKVIDFGIAKATSGQWLTDKTIVTGIGQFLGTPAYTSPEQAEGGGDVDTRSDIYSLGVLLYELLTGHTPFDSRELIRGGWEMMRHAIRQTEPQRPSTRLTALTPEELTRVARSRRTEPPRLIHAVRGDLDWIIMKCLEKERARRYDTCSGIIQDIHGHLHNEPVAARPPSKVYRFQKLVQRHKVKLSVGAVLAVAVFTGLGFASWSIGKGKEAQAQIDFFKSSQVHRTVLPRNRPVEVLVPESPMRANGIPAGVSTTWKRAVETVQPHADLIYSPPQSHHDGGADEQDVPLSGEVSLVSVAGPATDADDAVTPPGMLSSASASGASYPQLAAAWWEWFMQMPLTNSTGAVHPNLDTPFFDVSEGQSGGVWFLATPFGNVTRSCVIPPDTWIFLGTLNVESSSLEGGTPFFGVTAQEQSTMARYFADHIVGLFCEIDGVLVPDLNSYRVQSPQITVSVPTPWVFGTVGGRGTSVGDGYFILIKPFGPGRHTVHYGGAFQFLKPPDLFELYAPMEMTYVLTVP